MKIFIGSDIEGVASLASFEEISSESSATYDRAAIQMSKEISAACRGALKAGAREVVVKDAHSSGMNIIQDYLPKEVMLIRGSTKTPFSMIGGIDKSFDAIMFIGYHDSAGSKYNPMAHTISGRTVREIKINGQNVGELHIFMYAAAYLGVPTVFVSGDNEICKKAQLLNENILTVGTKEGSGSSVKSIHPVLAEELIEKNVIDALNGDFKERLIELPEKFSVEISYNKHYDATKASNYPGAVYLDEHTIRFETKDYYEVLRFLYFVI